MSNRGRYAKYSAADVLKAIFNDDDDSDLEDSDNSSLENDHISEQSDHPNSATPNLGPGHIGPAKRSENTDAVALRKKNSKDIWDEGEVPEGSEYDDTFDSRQQPECV
ncbi:PIHD3 protein, partial [Polypterus senegalus]